MSRVYAGHVSLNDEKRFSTSKAFIAQSATHAPLVETRYLMDGQLAYSKSIYQLAFLGFDTKHLLLKRQPSAKLKSTACIGYQALNPDKTEEQLYEGALNLVEDYYNRTGLPIAFSHHRQQAYFLNKDNIIEQGPFAYTEDGKLDFKEEMLLICRKRKEVFYAYCLQKEIITDAQAYQSGALLGRLAHKVHRVRRKFYREGLGADPDAAVAPITTLLL